MNKPLFTNSDTGEVILTQEMAVRLRTAMKIWRAIYGTDFDSLTLKQDEVDRFNAILNGEVEK